MPPKSAATWYIEYSILLKNITPYLSFGFWILHYRVLEQQQKNNDIHGVLLWKLLIKTMHFEVPYIKTTWTIEDLRWLYNFCISQFFVICKIKNLRVGDWTSLYFLESVDHRYMICFVKSTKDFNKLPNQMRYGVSYLKNLTCESLRFFTKSCIKQTCHWKIKWNLTKFVSNIFL